MVQKKDSNPDQEIDDIMAGEFADLNFAIVYEGLGENWDWNKQPVLMAKYMRSEVVNQLKFGSKTEYEDRKVYTLKSSSGQLVAVWGSINLNRAFLDISVGAMMRLTYTGKSEIGDAGREVKDFIVEVAQPKS
jgi:hypothetical protein